MVAKQRLNRRKRAKRAQIPRWVPEVPVRPVESKTLDEVTSEWDTMASVRHRQIRSGDDVSYSHVLLPCIFDMLGTQRRHRLLDVGCGTGTLSWRLRTLADSVCAIDPSPRSIALAGSAYTSDNLSFEVATAEHYAERYVTGEFEVAVANMVLMDVLDLSRFLAAVRKLLAKGGWFVATLTHPWFWPTYWGYSTAPWFNYDREFVLEAAFRIHSEQSPHVTTHVHRPLQRYVRELQANGLRLETLTEPIPREGAPLSYLSGWAFPRFLGLRCVAE